MYRSSIWQCSPWLSNVFLKLYELHCAAILYSHRLVSFLNAATKALPSVGSWNFSGNQASVSFLLSSPSSNLLHLFSPMYSYYNVRQHPYSFVITITVNLISFLTTQIVLWESGWKCKLPEILLLLIIKLIIWECGNSLVYMYVKQAATKIVFPNYHIACVCEEESWHTLCVFLIHKNISKQVSSEEFSANENEKAKKFWLLRTNCAQSVVLWWRTIEA